MDLMVFWGLLGSCEGRIVRSGGDMVGIMCVKVSGVEISRKIPGVWEDFRGMGYMGDIGFHGNRVS